MKAMRSNQLISLGVLLAAVVIRTDGWTQTRPTFLPLPPGVVELTGIGVDGGMTHDNIAQIAHEARHLSGWEGICASMNRSVGR